MTHGCASLGGGAAAAACIAPTATDAPVAGTRARTGRPGPEARNAMRRPAAHGRAEGRGGRKTEEVSCDKRWSDLATRRSGAEGVIQTRGGGTPSPRFGADAGTAPRARLPAAGRRTMTRGTGPGRPAGPATATRRPRAGHRPAPQDRWEHRPGGWRRDRVRAAGPRRERAPVPRARPRAAAPPGSVARADRCGGGRGQHFRYGRQSSFPIGVSAGRPQMTPASRGHRFETVLSFRASDGSCAVSVTRLKNTD